MFACQRVRNVESCFWEIESSLAQEFLPWGSQEAQPSSPSLGPPWDLHGSPGAKGLCGGDKQCLPAKYIVSFMAKERERSPWGTVCLRGAQLRETEHILNIHASKPCQT